MNKFTWMTGHGTDRCHRKWEFIFKFEEYHNMVLLILTQVLK